MPDALAGNRALAGTALGLPVTLPTIDMQVVDDITAGSRTATVPFNCVAYVFVWGSGGSGGSGARNGGGGAGGAYLKERLKKGDVLSYTVAAGAGASGANTDGNAGNASSITTPSRSMTANGGGAGTGSAGAGGSASGGDVNRTGSTATTDGGAAATFADLGLFPGGVGTAGFSQAVSGVNNGPAGGGGTGRNANTGGTSGATGAGRVLIIYARTL